jgi:hypothetical protein
LQILCRIAHFGKSLGQGQQNGTIANQKPVSSSIILSDSEPKKGDSF